ncbi:TPA: hypothetical protein ACIUGH_003399 [Salmonella enterica subsp. enterica serovar Saintpaul]|uniref:hypothetical protein n=1 Tax=Klebsiella africana TaxID=2489010 RepID=UPI001933F953|nr:hypothetical protein [Klebsiella africana]QRF15327.1 hypothetical protein H1X61_25820 [Klebsiella africana]HCQ3781669.1 hypothetical protein [Escherichia coli]
MSKIIDFPTEKKRVKRAKAIRARRNKEAQRRSVTPPSQFWWAKKIKLLTVFKKSARFLLIYFGLLTADILIYLLFIIGKFLKFFTMIGIIAALLFLVMEYRDDWYFTQSAFHAAAIFVSLIALRIGHDKLLNSLIRLKFYISR